MLSPFSVSIIFSYTLWSLTAALLPWRIFLTLLNKTIIFEWQFTAIPITPINFIILNDPKGVLFSCVVFIISARVLNFSNSYIATDLFISRFTILVLLFILSINILLYIPHLIALLLGWDGLGLTSFLLVAYYQKPGSWGAAIITALSNRIGDVIILITIGWSLNQGHWNILTPHYRNFSMWMAASIIIAGITKSAQIPFSAWLPAAIAAPTPVSALVHSSTLVTAGVFLLLRFYPAIKTFKSLIFFLTLIATLTIFIASLAALLETDIKKIIALSTLRQLGVIITAIGLNIPLLAFFHLLTHALFKALLFICAGRIIHYFHHTQDLRHIGNALNQMPVSATALLIASLALSGAPFMAGFYSKDLILEFGIRRPTNLRIVALLIFRIFLTTAYSIRLIFTIFWSTNNFTPLQNINNSHFRWACIPLTLGAVIGGAIINWFILHPTNEPILSSSIKWSPLIILILSLIITISLILTLTTKTSQIKSFYTIIPRFKELKLALISIWFIAPISTTKLNTLPMSSAHKLLKLSDHGWVETFSSIGLKTFTQSIILPPTSIITNNLSTHLLLSIFIITPLLTLL